jgi:hypothetical protein
VSSYEDLQFLFSYHFFEEKISSFFFHQKLGFCIKDYAEFSIEYEPIERMELSSAEFTIGDMKVTVSPYSSLFYLLIKQMDREDVVEALYNVNDWYDRLRLQELGTIENIRKVHSYTIKLKKISLSDYNSPDFLESLQNDLYSSLYYLRALYPTRYNELPQIINPLSEVELDDEASVNLKSYMDISLKIVDKPSYPVALRFFYHADILVLKGVGQEAVLYYYKVIEHFFKEAWRSRIEELILREGSDTHRIAELLVDNYPRNERDYLPLVVNFDQTDPVWETIKKYEFCEISADSEKTIVSLAEKIYEIRNQFAHGNSWFAHFPGGNQESSAN